MPHDNDEFKFDVNIDCFVLILIYCGIDIINYNSKKN